jgi:pyruvyl transferase EpsO
MASRNGSVISAQRRRLEEVLGRYVGPGAPYALLDFPDHSNVGDSAIYAGEVRILTELSGAPPRYVSTFCGFDPARLARACPDGPILFHGGGNFGDLWPAHQEFREKILARYPDRKIVQLPQSIHFQDEANVARCARAIAAHKDFHLLVRDRRGEAFARERFDCPVELSPDSAFALGPLPRRGASDLDVLLLLRTDLEARGDRPGHPLPPRWAEADWLGDDSLSRTARAAIRLEALLQGRFGREAREEWKFARLAMRRVERGLKLLSRGRGLITDRLHAHILAILLDVPHVVLDNMYGKITSYLSCWTSEYPAVRVCSTLSEAREAMPALLRDIDAAPAAGPAAAPQFQG